MAIDDLLGAADRAALLGVAIGPDENRFDPGRQGSYFQTPEEVVRSLARVRRFKLSRFLDNHRKSLRSFQTLLEECQAKGLGVYVTF